MDKKEIRKHVKDLKLDKGDRYLFNASLLINNQLFQQYWFKKAKRIGFYVSKELEVETILTIEQILKEKRISVPKVEGSIMNFYHIKSLTDLTLGAFHVFEPTTSYYTKPSEMDIMIVPVVAFNRKKYRVGYGKGYYDKYLKNFKGHTIGLAFSIAEVDEDFEDEFDIPLDMVITEKEVIK